MTFIDITSTASVRSVLGVSELELRDTVLLDPIYSTLLVEALYDLHPQMLADFTATTALPSPTTDQLRFLNLTQAWAAYWIGQECLTSIPMFAPVLIKDSKTEVQRTQDPYANLRRDVGATLALLRLRLLTVYPLINPSAVAPPPVERLMAAGVSLGTDPVLGG